MCVCVCVLTSENTIKTTSTILWLSTLQSCCKIYDGIQHVMIMDLDLVQLYLNMFYMEDIILNWISQKFQVSYFERLFWTNSRTYSVLNIHELF